MSGRSHTLAQIAACRRDMGSLAACWRAVALGSRAGSRVEAEAQVFNQMVVALDLRFADRDGGAADEVRMLALGVAQGGYFPSYNVVWWRPEASVTGYRAGDRIALSEAVFARLATAYLDAVAG